MLNPILAFSATRRMRSFRTMLIVIAYMAALLVLALVILSPFLATLNPFLFWLIHIITNWMIHFYIIQVLLFLFFAS